MAIPSRKQNIVDIPSKKLCLLKKVKLKGVVSNAVKKTVKPLLFRSFLPFVF